MQNITKRKFLTTGILGAIISFFTSSLVGKADTINQLPNINKKSSISSSKELVFSYKIKLNKKGFVIVNREEYDKNRLISHDIFTCNIPKDEIDDFISGKSKSLSIIHSYSFGDNFKVS
jgi:hypothetical protein